jgi:hypothetical protein
MWRPWADRGHLWAGCERRSCAVAPLSPRLQGGARWRHGFTAFMGVCLFGWALCCPIPAHSQTRVVLPSATDLPQALAQALAQGQPLVVMVSLDNCPYCRQVRQSHLGPLWRGGQVVVQIDMQHKETLTDWDGQTRSHGDWVKNRRISVAPTVLFFGPDGREVADRLEGASLPDFYGAYLDQRLAQARQRLLPRAGANSGVETRLGPGESSGVGVVTALQMGLAQHQTSAPARDLEAWAAKGKH